MCGGGASKKNYYTHSGNRNKKLAGNLVGPTTSGEAQEPITGSRIASRRTNSRINTRLPRLSGFVIARIGNNARELLRSGVELGDRDGNPAVKDIFMKSSSRSSNWSFFLNNYLSIYSGSK